MMNLIETKYTNNGTIEIYESDGRFVVDFIYPDMYVRTVSSDIESLTEARQIARNFVDSMRLING